MPSRDARTGTCAEAWFASWLSNLTRGLRYYHKRSNVESSFSALKRKFGEALRSKTDLAKKNELLAKVVCHNITCVIHEMYALGIDP